MATGKANKIQSSSFNIALCEQYKILIQLGLKNFSYCIIHNDTNNVEYFRNLIVNDDIINVINKEEILKSNFASSSVLYTNFPGFSLSAVHNLTPFIDVSPNSNVNILGNFLTQALINSVQGILHSQK